MSAFPVFAPNCLLYLFLCCEEADTKSDAVTTICLYLCLSSWNRSKSLILSAWKMPMYLERRRSSTSSTSVVCIFESVLSM